ncbi:MAG: hypothetical protein AAF491_10745 [Verrucomicrobiota bacterium]
MNQRSASRSHSVESENSSAPALSPATSGYFSCCEPGAPNREVESLPLGKELVELCTEIAGVLLRGYSDGKSGREVRQIIVEGLISRIGAKEPQAQALVDLSLELIHLEAYGRLRGTAIDFSYLVARSRGGFEDLSAN